MNMWKRLARFVVILLVVVWVLASVAAGPLLPYVLLQSTPLPDNHRFQTEHPHEEHHIIVEEGSLHALYFPVVKPKGVVLYFHGNRRSLERWSRVADRFVRRGYAVFLPDYRGYGKSRGSLNEDRFYADALACYDYVRKQWPGLDVSVYGRSLGSAAATHVASRNSCRLLFLETPFSSIPDVVDTYVPLLPRLIYFSYKLENKHNVSITRCPVWIVAGRRDRVVPLECAVRLKKLLKPGDHWAVIENGTHYNIHNFDAYQAMLDDAFGKPEADVHN